MPVLVTEITRIKNHSPDPHPFTLLCHKKILAQAQKESRTSVSATSSEAFTRSFEKAFIRVLRGRFAPFVMKPVVRVLTAMLAFALTGLSVYLISVKELGYAPHELFESGSSLKRGVELTFTRFTLFGANLVFNDLDVAENQLDILKVYRDITASEWHSEYFLPPYPSMLPVMGEPTGDCACIGPPPQFGGVCRNAPQDL